MQEHTITQPRPGWPAAYLANGLIGLRVGPVPLPGGIARVGGFVGLSPERHTEAYNDAPYPLTADLALDGVWLSQRPDLVSFERQSLAMACGELRSRFTFHGASTAATVEVVTLCSRSHPTLALQQIAVKVRERAKLTMQVQLEPPGPQGRLKQRFMPATKHDAVIEFESAGGLSSVGMASITELVGDARAVRRRNDSDHEGEWPWARYEVEAAPGQVYELRQYTSMVPSLMHAEPHWQAARLVEHATWYGFESLREANRAAWAELWHARPRIIGAEQHWQRCADAAYFYVHSSVHAASPCSVAPFGLSQRTHYLGHVFWDAETFLFPVTLLSNPEAARAMLGYRSRCLPAAAFNAQLNGYAGVQYPWQSANSGSEVTRYTAGACGGVAEQHVNLDVAFAVAQYAHASDDEPFVRDHAWPVIEGVARWIVSRVTPTRRGYEIRHVTGIDELIDNVHNNAYTNLAAVVVLRQARDLARRLGMRPPAAWGKVAERMFVPMDAQGRVILKHEGYRYDGGMCIPETLAALFPLGYSHGPEVDEATVRYHLDLAHTYVGMPMLSSLLGVFAARLGEREMALELFEQGILPYAQEPYMQFNETARVFEGPFTYSGATVFLTNPAGFLLALMYGLTGLELDGGDPADWCRRKVVLPTGWEAIEVERVWIRGEAMRLIARHGADRADLNGLMRLD